MKIGGTTMNWERIKLLFSEQLISEFENEVGYAFPVEFREVVINNNGASPELKEFSSKQKVIVFREFSTDFYHSIKMIV